MPGMSRMSGIHGMLEITQIKLHQNAQGGGCL